MNSSRFDEFTKALARPTSRRRALKGALGALAGGVVAIFLPGRAAQADTSACAHFCDSVFGTDTPAAMQCISDAAHHKGLCYTCGPASGSTKPICCPKNGSGYCSSYSSASCCTSGQGCCSGTCTNLNMTSNCGSCGTTCTGTTPACCSSSCKDLSNDVNNCGACGTTCPSGQICQNGTYVTCTATGGTCSGNTDCCSGNCSNGICCGSGQVGLCNGSCATPCNTFGTACSGSCGSGTCGGDVERYCTTLIGNSTICNTDCDCPKGSFCPGPGLPCGNLC